jgi:hypothetical protein
VAASDHFIITCPPICSSPIRRGDVFKTTLIIKVQITYLNSLHKSWVILMTHICNPSTWEAEAGGFQVQD